MEHTIDVKGKRLGRVATEISNILQGKKHPNYDPKNVGADRVLVKNYAQLTIGGKKVEQKKYRRHTGYVGHVKTKTFKEAVAKDPRWVLRQAVRKMLPRNFLTQRRMRNLIFVEE